MPTHSHQFVETYSGLVGYGFDRETDESTLVYYLQKFSDDRLMGHIVKKFSGEEMEALFTMVSGLLKKHLTEPEYHRLFLKDNHH